MKKRRLFLLGVLAGICGFVGCEKRIPQVERIDMRGSIKIGIGGMETLIAFISPKEAAGQKIIWYNTNTDVVRYEVDKQLVTGLQPGTATITVSVGGVSAKCIVTVEPHNYNDSVIDLLADPALRAYGESQMPVWDTNKNGFLGRDEANAVTEMDISGLGISLPWGINHFGGLVSLDCSDNALEWLYLPNCPALTELKCEGNPGDGETFLVRCRFFGKDDVPEEWPRSWTLEDGRTITVDYQKED